MATFAPKPVCVISDGKDWTASVPWLEYPYLQRIFGFYNAARQISNVHLPTEAHDFGVNKRKAVYDFFIDIFSLNAKMLDETRVTIEPERAMYSFGDKAEKMPANAGILNSQFKKSENTRDRVGDVVDVFCVQCGKANPSGTDCIYSEFALQTGDLLC